MKLFSSIKQTFNRIVAWQKSPVIPPENTREETVCMNCGETFAANFCPRCGQNRKTERLSIKKAFRLFLDTWGLSMHGLLYTIWHLFARPGYMIKDYLDGHRQPYFPPFKTLLVVGTAYAITFALAGGFSEKAIQDQKEHNELVKKSIQEANKKEGTAKAQSRDEKVKETASETAVKDIKLITEFSEKYNEWRKHNMVIEQMLMHIVFAFIVWRLFRKAPRRPGTNLAENIIAQVYICAQLGVIGIGVIIYEALTLPYPTGGISWELSFVAFAYDYKQLFGYSLLRTLWKTFLSYIIFMALTILLVGSLVLLVGIHTGVNAAMT